MEAHLQAEDQWGHEVVHTVPALQQAQRTWTEVAHLQIDQRNHRGQVQLNLAHRLNLEVEWVPDHQQEVGSATEGQVADPRDHQLPYQPEDIDGVGTPTSVSEGSATGVEVRCEEVHSNPLQPVQEAQDPLHQASVHLLPQGEKQGLPLSAIAGDRHADH